MWQVPLLRVLLRDGRRRCPNSAGWRAPAPLGRSTHRGALFACHGDWQNTISTSKFRSQRYQIFMIIRYESEPATSN
eukprot:COSAG06_NODE_32790_length_500_cov_1.014963_2_plen_76_part_01